MTIVFKYSGKAEGGIESWATVALPYSYSKNLPDLMMFRVSDFRPATTIAPGNTVVPGVTKFPIYRVRQVGGGVVLNDKPPSDPHSEIWALSGVFPTYAPLGRPGANNTVWGTFAGENLVQPNPNDEIITPPLNGLIGDLEYPTPQDVYQLQALGLPAPNIINGQETIENYRIPRGSGSFIPTPWQNRVPEAGRETFLEGWGLTPLPFSLQDGEATNYGGDFNPVTNPTPPYISCPGRFCVIGDQVVDHAWLGVFHNAVGQLLFNNGQAGTPEIYYDTRPNLPLSAITPIAFPAGIPDPYIWSKIKNPPYVTDSDLQNNFTENNTKFLIWAAGVYNLLISQDSPKSIVGSDGFEVLEESAIRKVIKFSWRTQQNGISVFIYYYLYKNFNIIPFSVKLIYSDRQGLTSYSQPAIDTDNFSYGNHNPEHIHLQSLYLVSDMPMAIHNAASHLPPVGDGLGNVETLKENPNADSAPGLGQAYDAQNAVFGNRRYKLRIDGDWFVTQTIAYGPENGLPEVNLNSTTHYRKYYSEGGGNYWFGIQWNNDAAQRESFEVFSKEIVEYGLPDGTYIWTKGNC